MACVYNSIHSVYFYFSYLSLTSNSFNIFFFSLFCLLFQSFLCFTSSFYEWVSFSPVALDLVYLFKSIFNFHYRPIVQFSFFLQLFFTFNSHVSSSVLFLSLQYWVTHIRFPLLLSTLFYITEIQVFPFLPHSVLWLNSKFYCIPPFFKHCRFFSASFLNSSPSFIFQYQNLCILNLSLFHF